MSPSLLKEPVATRPDPPVGAPGEPGSMKLLSLFIRPEHLDRVTDAVDKLSVVGGMTISDVRGFGRQKGQVEHYRGGEYTIRFVPKVRVDMAVRADDMERVMTAVSAAARTGQVGDGKVFVLELHNAMRVRTGERGISAL